MGVRYTVVFEFDEEPKIKGNDSWLGGKLCIVQFSDALKELEILRGVVEAIAFGDDDGDPYTLAQQTLDILN